MQVHYLCERLLDKARSQIGKTESPKNSNKCVYNTWYYGGEVSGPDFPWCMVFVQWCFDQIGFPLPYRSASCKWTLAWWKKNKRDCVTYIKAQPGDIVIYKFGHCGIVEKDNGKTITAIEGNTAPDDNGCQYNGGAVARKIRRKTSVEAFIRPKWPEDEDVRYSVLSQVPNAYQKSVKKLIDKGLINGYGSNGVETVIDLSDDMCRIITIFDRGEVFDK